MHCKTPSVDKNRSVTSVSWFIRHIFPAHPFPVMNPIRPNDKKK